MTSLQAGKDLHQADSILLTTIARAQNTGMEYSASGDELLAIGTSPLLLEPVDLNLGLPEEYDFEVQVLDHDGRLTDKRLPVSRQEVEISGRETKSKYYLITRK